MRAALWLLALFGVAVAVALFAGNNQAVVTIFWPPHRVDISFNLMVLLLAGLFFVLYLALRAVSAVFSLPAEARRWRAQQKERAMYGALDGFAGPPAGRALHTLHQIGAKRAGAGKSLALLADQSGHVTGHSASRGGQLRALAHLLVAEAAQSLQNKGLRDQHLHQALQSSAPRHAQEVREGVQFRAARWALDDRDAGAALDWLAQLPQGASRRTLALRMKLRASRHARQTSQALETARLLGQAPRVFAGGGAKHHPRPGAGVAQRRARPGAAAAGLVFTRRGRARHARAGGACRVAPDGAAR